MAFADASYLHARNAMPQESEHHPIMSIVATARLTFKGTNRTLPGAFGAGCAELLEGVAEERSLNRAAKRIGMAYSKAWRIIKEAEEQLGCELLARNGARGSTLTDEGQRVLAAYRQLEQELNDLLDRRLPELLG